MNRRPKPKRKGVNPFLSMMSTKTREKLSYEPEPWKCSKCTTRKKDLKALQGHWNRVHQKGVMPEIQPSASDNMILDPALTLPKPKERNPQVEIKMDPLTQQRKVSYKPKQSFKNLPEGWTREKVAIAYDGAPLRGVPKNIFIKKWNEKYDFKLTSRKVRKWVDLFLKKVKNESEEEDSDI